MEKITQKNAITFVLENYDLPTEYAEKFNQMLDALEKRKSAPRAPSADVVANQKLREAILKAMEPQKRYTVGELKDAVPELAECSIHKVSALLTPLKNSGAVVREEVKRKPYFFKP